MKKKIEVMIRQRLNDDELSVTFERLKSVELINGKGVAFKNLCNAQPVVYDNF